MQKEEVCRSGWESAAVERAMASCKVSERKREDVKERDEKTTNG
jgi:hypothetical protein